MFRFKLLIVSLSFISSTLWAFPVLHFIKPESSFTQITTLDACTTFFNSLNPVSCNPALFPYVKDEGLRLGIATITDGESVQTGKKLLFDPIKEDFLREIFEKNSFNTWGANTSLELRNTKFYLSYNPISVNSDVYVFNPASPEVAMSLFKSNRLQLTSGLEFIKNNILKASVGAKLFYYRSEYFQDSFFLSELAGREIKEIIKLDSQSGIAGDLGFFFKFNSNYLPKVSFLMKNIGSKFSNDEEDIISENQMRSLLVYENYSRIGLGYDYKTKYGGLNFEVNLPFNKFYESYYSEYVVGTIEYALSKFATQFTVSKYQQVFGFNFGSRIASIGIFYGRSRALGDFSNLTENMGGISAEISL